MPYNLQLQKHRLQTMQDKILAKQIRNHAYFNKKI